MLPGKAIRLPRPSRLRSRLATKATPTPYQGPSSTAHSTLTMCCIGAHLLPNTGKLRTCCPQQHRRTAHRPDASFFGVGLFHIEYSFCNKQKSGRLPQNIRSQPRTGNTPRKKGVFGSVEAYWLPLTPEHGFPSLSITKLRALPLSSGTMPVILSFPLKQHMMQKSRARRGTPAKKKTVGKVLPTVAWSTSGIKGRNSNFLSANQAPLISLPIATLGDDSPYPQKGV